MDPEDRKRGILTEDDREFLLGKKTHLSQDGSRSARKRIRDRSRNALLDFTHLVDAIDDSWFDEGSHQDIHQLYCQGESGPDERMEDGVIDAIAFLYLCFSSTSSDSGRDTDEWFTTVIEEGLARAIEIRSQNKECLNHFHLRFEYGDDILPSALRAYHTGGNLSAEMVKALQEADEIDDNIRFNPVDVGIDEPSQQYPE